MVTKRSSSYPAHRNDSRSTAETLGVAASLAGIAASLASVAGFLLSLRSGDGLWLLCGAGTAVFFLYAAWRRRRMAVAASAAILALVGVGALLAHFHISIKPTAASPSANAPVAAHSIAPSGPSSSLPATQASANGATQTRTSTPPPRVLEVTLPDRAATDVDSGGQPAVANGQIGPTGSYDLYNGGDGFIHAHDGMYAYPDNTSPDSAYAICSDYTSANPSANTYESEALDSTGITFCFRTTAGKMAWATVEGVQSGTSAAALQVYVWG